MSEPLPPYFAYGSNMPSAQMAERCPGAVALGAARLRGRRLAFNAWSERRGGLVADVPPAPGGGVWGVLWRVTEAHAAALDRYEGVARGQYRRASVRVERPGGGETDAFAYVIRAPGVEGPTTAAYRALLVEGAREHGLPAAWVRLLEAVPVAPAAER